MKKLAAALSVLMLVACQSSDDRSRQTADSSYKTTLSNSSLDKAFLAKLSDSIDIYRSRISSETDFYYGFDLTLRYFEAVQKNHVDEVDWPTVARQVKLHLAEQFGSGESTIDGKELALAILDAALPEFVESSYLDLSDFIIKPNQRSSFGGIGLWLTKENNSFLITKLHPRSPGLTAGLAVGQQILAVDGLTLQDQRVEEVVELLKGVLGTTVELLVMQNGKEKTVSIERVGTDDLPSISITEKSGISLINIDVFNERTPHILKNKLKKLNNNDKPLILDVRDNMGGLFSAAIDVSDMFIDSGKVIVEIRGRKGVGNSQTLRSTSEMLSDAEIIILTNDLTAAGTELFVRSLKIHRNALIIGERSFGRGTVQSIIPLNKNFAGRITTSRMYDANGESLDEPIVPDILITDDRATGRDSILERALVEAKNPRDWNVKNGS